MRSITYKPIGICASRIDVVLNDDDTIQDIAITGGCDGNHKGLISLCRGMKRTDVIEKLSGIRCGFKASSCPDQLAKALEVNQ